LLGDRRKKQTKDARQNTNENGTLHDNSMFESRSYANEENDQKVRINKGDGGSRSIFTINFFWYGDGGNDGLIFLWSNSSFST
jgi:hypothetical protein